MVRNFNKRCKNDDMKMTMRNEEKFPQEKWK
jgi:hypothetical protein